MLYVRLHPSHHYCGPIRQFTFPLRTERTQEEAETSLAAPLAYTKAPQAQRYLYTTYCSIVPLSQFSVPDASKVEGPLCLC